LQGSSEADKICDFVELTAEPQLLPFAPKRDLQSNPAGLRQNIRYFNFSHSAVTLPELSTKVLFDFFACSRSLINLSPEAFKLSK